MMEHGFYPTLIGCAVGLFFYLLCLCEDYWITGDNVAHYGLWRVCYKNDKCYGIENKFNMDVPRWMNGVQVCAALSVFILAAGLIMVILRIVFYSPRMIYPALTLVLSPFCMMVALSVFTGCVGPELPAPYEWGWGFIIAWLITCTAPILGGYLIYTVKDD